MQFKAENTDFFSAGMQSPMPGASLAGDLLPGDYHGVCCFRSHCSAVFPLLISVSKEYRIKFKHEQVSRIMFMPFLSSFLLTGLTGEMIGWDVGLLFLCLVGMGGGLWVVGKKLLQVLEE